MSKKGFGIKLEYTTDGGTTFLVVGEVVDGTPSGITKGTYETTHHASPNGHKEFEAGLVEFGEATLMINYDPADVGHLELRTRAATAHETANAYKFTYGGSTIDTFSAFCVGFEPATPIDDKITASVTFKPAGTVAQATT